MKNLSRTNQVRAKVGIPAFSLIGKPYAAPVGALLAGIVDLQEDVVITGRNTAKG